MADCTDDTHGVLEGVLQSAIGHAEVFLVRYSENVCCRFGFDSPQLRCAARGEFGARAFDEDHAVTFVRKFFYGSRTGQFHIIRVGADHHHCVCHRPSPARSIFSTRR